MADGLLSNATLSTLSTLLDLRESQRCTALTDEDLHRMLDALLANPRYQGGGTRHHLHHMKARLYRQEQSLDGAMHHLEAAFAAKPDIGTAVLMIGTLLSAGLHDEALALIAAVREQAPANPVLRARWMELLDQLHEQMDNLKPSS